jgi:hypothetical protein
MVLKPTKDITLVGALACGVLTGHLFDAVNQFFDAVKLSKWPAGDVNDAASLLQLGDT